MSVSCIIGIAIKVNTDDEDIIDINYLLMAAENSCKVKVMPTENISKEHEKNLPILFTSTGKVLSRNKLNKVHDSSRFIYRTYLYVTLLYTHF